MCFDLSPLCALLSAQAGGWSVSSSSSGGLAAMATCPPPPPSRRVSTSSSGHRSRASSFHDAGGVSGRAMPKSRKTSTVTNPRDSGLIYSQQQGHNDDAAASGTGVAEKVRRESRVEKVRRESRVEKEKDVAIVTAPPTAVSQVEESGGSWGWEGVLLESGTLVLSDVLVGAWTARPDERSEQLLRKQQQEKEEQRDRESKRKTWRASDSSTGSSEVNAKPTHTELVYIFDLITNSLSLYEFTA